MKTKKHILFMLVGLVVIAAFVLAACGTSSNNTSNTASQDTSQSATPAPAPAPAPKETLKLAFIGPLTGPNATEGIGPRNTFDLAVKQANAAGDLPFNLEAVFYDDASDPGTAASVAQKIVSDPDVVAVSGHWNTACAEASNPIFISAGIPDCIWGAIGPGLTSADNMPYITRICPTSVQENVPLAAFVMDNLGWKKWAVISSTSVYGKANEDAWQSEIGKRDGATVASVDEITDGSTDFRPILSRIKDEGVDALYYGGNIMEAALIRKQMNEVGLQDVPMCGISGIVSPTFIEVAGDAAEGVVVTQPGAPTEKMPGGPEFIQAYQDANYSDPYGAYGAYAYDSANVIIAAIKEVGQKDSKAIAQAIANISYNGLLGTTTFDNVGQTTNSLSTIYVVQDGQFVPWDDSKYATGELKLPGAK